jgi:hypothetical protein
MVSRLVLLLGCLVVGCATPNVRDRGHQLSYGCDDVVVVGRVTTVGRSDISDQAPLPGWRSRWQLQVDIKRVIRGRERRSTVPATFVAHGQLLHDVDFLAVLSPARRGGYILKSAAGLDDQPRLRLIEPCS